MKKILILLAALGLVGCDSIETEKIKTTETTKIKYYRNDNSFIYSIEIEGHLYIVFDGYHEGSIIHAEHCPCRMVKHKKL